MRDRFRDIRLAPIVGRDNSVDQLDPLRQRGARAGLESAPRSGDSHVDIGREIPAELYGAVAEVLAYVYQINNTKRREYAPA